MLLGGDWVRQRILSEAPGDDENDPEATADDPGEAADYQLDDGDTNTPEDEGDNPPEGEDGDPNAEEGTDGDETTDYTDLDGADGEQTGEEDDQGGEDGDDLSMDDDSGDGDGESLKKMILLSQFKELNSLLGSLSLSADNLDREDEFEGDDNFDYLQDKIIELKRKMNFVLSEKFLKSNYAELLKLFYYFKYSLNDLAKMAEKLVDAGNKNKQ